MVGQKILILKVVTQKKICKRKNELKSPIFTGKLLLERKIEVINGRHLMPLSRLLFPPVLSLKLAGRKAWKGVAVWM